MILMRPSKKNQEIIYTTCHRLLKSDGKARKHIFYIVKFGLKIGFFLEEKLFGNGFKFLANFLADTKKTTPNFVQLITVIIYQLKR